MTFWQRDPDRANLRSLLDRKDYVLMVGAFDAWSAKMVESAGIDAVSVTGAGTAGTRGWPDIGVMGAEVLAETVESMRRVVDIPILSDIDTGFGGPVNVARTIRLIEEAGGSAVHMEDQVNPKRTGGSRGIAVVSIEEMQERIAAATAARASKDFLIVARTDSIMDHGLDEAIERCDAYTRAGADLTLVVVPQTKDEMIEIGRRAEGRKMFNITTANESPSWPLDEIVDAGYQLIDIPLFMLYSALDGMRKFLSRLVDERRAVADADETSRIAYLNELLGIERYQRFQNELQPTA